MSYVQYVTNEKVETLIECHLNAFKYFGGVPVEGLYDNMCPDRREEMPLG